ncbi:MAG: DUF2007 domain-containing protein [Gammaproteobacteria bacterium]|nr:DUF2007 domain-containing protein [Gammaproteobacteria bacterium]
MHKVYAHENLAFVQLAKGLLELNNIQCFMKNEYHAAGGHVGFGMIPIELWVYNSADELAATVILAKQYGKHAQGAAWVCKSCQETNDDSFETCWKCQTERA